MNGFDTDFDRYHEFLSQQLRGLHITDIRVLTKTDYLFVFSETKSILLAVSMAPSQPLLSIVTSPFDYTPLPRIEIAPIRHHVIKMKIDTISRLNNDLIIEFQGHKKADNFDIINYRLVFELIKNHPNFILMANQKIIWASHYHSLTEVRPLVPGLEYEAPLRQLSRLKRDFVNEARLYEQNLQDLVLLEHYRPLRQQLTKRERQLHKKLENLNLDLTAWNRNLTYKDVADYILTYLDVSTRLENITYDEVFYQLDPALTLADNAKQLYKRYRKARLAKAPIEEEINKANAELAQIKSLLDEGLPRTFFEIESLKARLINLHLLRPDVTIGKKLDINQKRPYMLYSDGIRYSFGRNAVQNDYLTFSLASKDDMFFHVTNHPGAHVICHQPDPDQAMIMTAASIALLLSRLETGEVAYAKVATLKKGRQLGQVILKKHQAIRLTQINPYLRDLIKNAKRHS